MCVGSGRKRDQIIELWEDEVLLTLVCERNECPRPTEDVKGDRQQHIS